MALESYTVDEAFAALKAKRAPQEPDAEENNEIPEDTPEDDVLEGVEVDEPDQESDEDHSEPAIEPPVSWSTDLKDAFRNLPLDMQKTIADRDREREADYTRQKQLAAQKEKDAEALLIEARQTRERYLSELQQVVESAPTPPDPDLNDPDSDKYDPDKYARLNAKYARDRKVHDERSAELAKVTKEREEENKRAMSQWQQERVSFLSKEWPEILDPAKSPVLQEEIVKYATSRGLNAEALKYASGPELAVLKDALYGHSLRQKMPSQRTKNAPPVTRPGSPKSKKFSGSEKLQQMKQKALKSGKLQDMQAYLKASRNQNG